MTQPMQLFYGSEEEEGRKAIIVAEGQGDAEDAFEEHFGIENTGDSDDVGYVVWLLVSAEELRGRGCHEISD